MPEIPNKENKLSTYSPDMPNMPEILNKPQVPDMPNMPNMSEYQIRKIRINIFSQRFDSVNTQYNQKWLYHFLRCHCTNMPARKDLTCNVIRGIPLNTKIVSTVTCILKSDDNIGEWVSQKIVSELLYPNFNVAKQADIPATRGRYLDQMLRKMNDEKLSIVKEDALNMLLVTLIKNAKNRWTWYLRFNGEDSCMMKPAKYK